MINFPIRRRFRHGAEAAGVFLAWGLFSSLPLDKASSFGGWIARMIGPRLKVSGKARRNLCLAFPEKDSSEIDAILREVWDNLGRLAAEFPHLKRIAAERVEIVGRQHLDTMRNDRRPGLLVSAHFGGWELSGHLAGQLGLPVHVVSRVANNPWVEWLIRRNRGSGVESVIPKGPGGARKIVEVMRAGGHVAMLVDQKMNDGIAVPFMGRKAMTPPAAARLAFKFDCPIVAGRIERVGGAYFRAILEPPIPLPKSGDQERDVFDVMVEVNAKIERWVRARPGQWLWLHNRWPN